MSKGGTMSTRVKVSSSRSSNRNISAFTSLHLPSTAMVSLIIFYPDDGEVCTSHTNVFPPCTSLRMLDWIFFAFSSSGFQRKERVSLVCYRSCKSSFTETSNVRVAIVSTIANMVKKSSRFYVLVRQTVENTF